MPLDGWFFGASSAGLLRGQLRAASAARARYRTKRALGRLLPSHVHGPFPGLFFCDGVDAVLKPGHHLSKV